MDFDDPSSSEGGNVGSLSPVLTANGMPPPATAADAEMMPSRTPLGPVVLPLPRSRNYRSGHDVQSFVFDDDNDDIDNDDGDGNEVLGCGPQPATHTACEEPMHHQLFDVGEDLRPAARHGCDAAGNMGRLGHLTEETYVHESSEKEEASEEEEKEVVEEKESAKDIVTSDTGELGFIEDDREWDSVLAPMTLVDKTLLSCFYAGACTDHEDSEVELEKPVSITETMVKVISLFYSETARPFRDEAVELPQMALDTLRRLASHMQNMQRILTEAGLTIDSQLELQFQANSEEEFENDTAASQSGVDLRKVVCRGVHSVHVDSACRLIGVIDIDVCAVSLSDAIAFSSLPFSQSELVAIIKSIVQKVGVLHNAGLVHGCLHSGNILCCSDDGRTVLTGACGIMSNPLLPADASFISPRLASALQPFVQLVWKHGGEVHENNTLPWASDPLFHCAVLERYGCTRNTEMRAQVSDDIYAIGILAVSCLLGVPPFHSATLKEVVETLAPHYHDGHDDSAATLLGNVLASDYAVQRFQLAGYTDEFISTAKDFVNTCLRAASSPATASSQIVATDLLTHSFFAGFSTSLNPTRNSEEVSMCDEEMDEAARMDRTMHCLMYPIFMVIECAKKNCGTTPLLSRLLRNSIFASRWDALRRFQLHLREDEAVCGNDPTHVLWPYLGSQKFSRWDESNLQKSFKELKDNQNEETAVRSFLYQSLVDPCVQVSQKTAVCNVAMLASVVKSKGLHVDTEAHALVFSKKTDDHLVLYRDEVPTGYGSSVDTLILYDLENCVVEILLNFRFVVLFNLRRCKLFLGPCYYLYCGKVSDCTPVFVASSHLLMQDVTGVEFYSGGCSLPHSSSNLLTRNNVTVLPYTMAYAGLTADFAAVSLPQKHVSTMILGADVIDSAPFASRTFKLCNILRGGFDYPYSHALVAFGTLILHENDCLSDMFLFFSEAAGKAVRIAHVHGGHDTTSVTVSSHLSSQHSGHAENVGIEASDIAAERNGSNCPIIFIMDAVGDCIIEDCSHCTVFIVGSSGSVSVRHCSELCLFLMAKEVLFEYCDHVEAYLFVTESLLMDHCYQMDLFPLVLEAPRQEEIIVSIIDRCSDEALQQHLEQALHQKDECALNVLRRFEGGTDTIDMEECVDVRIDSYCEQVILVDFAPTGVPPSRFFDAASHGSRREKHWVVVPFLQKAWKGDEFPTRGRELPPMRLHDLVNASILRLPGSLNLRAARDKACPLVDVVLECLSYGVVHLVEAVKTLFIRRCKGPLDIVVCAANRVVMESCEHVTLQTACGAFIARNCHVCHTALHVNTPPQYENCTFMLASTLNITSKDFESYLMRAGVEVDLNLFDSPAARSSNPEWDALTFEQLSSSSVNSVERARSILHSPVTLVQPLPATCLGVEDASFLDVLEDRVNHESATRPDYDRNIVAALSFLSRRQLAQASAASESLKSVTREAMRFARSPSPQPTMPSTEQVQEHHFDPFVGCSVEEVMQEPSEAVEESSPLSVPTPTSELHQSPASNPDLIKTNTGYQDNDFRSGGSCSGSKGGEAHNDADAHSGDDTAEVVANVVAASHDDHAADDEDNSTTVRKWSQPRANKMSADRQCSTEAKRVSCEPSSPSGTFVDGQVSDDKEENAVDLVPYRSLPEEASLVDDRMSATDAVALTLRHKGDESAGEGSPLAVPPAHRRKGSGDALLTHSPPCQTLSVEDKNDEDRKGGSDKNEESTSTPQQGVLGGTPSLQDFILQVHPNEEEAVRSALAMVASSREASASARRVIGSSTKELQRRVAEALKRLQKPLS
ncbi:transferase [Trypanosoma rangeli]|uniref:Transferase n=1 Tax=Trypanosoma rangeli TaxID=5698 RepID=A0A3R7RST7_TRYRA|nr:transferase [Trypanosoma rangeli]RNF12168.1 transferase [Trypanosoma rangeli]|eukprot:RNF12168.1 transferase [Trypanosoma rangeli]